MIIIINNFIIIILQMYVVMFWALMWSTDYIWINFILVWPAFDVLNDAPLEDTVSQSCGACWCHVITTDEWVIISFLETKVLCKIFFLFVCKVLKTYNVEKKIWGTVNDENGGVILRCKSDQSFIDGVFNQQKL